MYKCNTLSTHSFSIRFQYQIWFHHGFVMPTTWDTHDTEIVSHLWFGYHSTFPTRQLSAKQLAFNRIRHVKILRLNIYKNTFKLYVNLFPGI